MEEIFAARLHFRVLPGAIDAIAFVLCGLEGLLALKPPQTAHLQVQSHLDELATILTWFDQFYHVSIPQVAWFQCQLVLAEGFTNAVRHAHQQLPPTTPIDLDIVQFADSIEMQIWDSGNGFDLNQALAQLPPQISLSAEGGRGLKLMQRLADTVSYCRVGDRNCLRLVKRFEAVL